MPVSRPPSAQSWDIVQDIAHHLQILPNWAIAHPDYGVLELPQPIAQYLSQLPWEHQRKYLQGQIRNYLYDIYFSGELLRQTSEESPDSDPELVQNNLVQNNTVYGTDWQFHQQLDRANQGSGYFDPGWQVVEQGVDHRSNRRPRWRVSKAGLTLQVSLKHMVLIDRMDRSIQAGQLAQAGQLVQAGQPVQVGQTVAIRLPKYQLDADSYIAIGNQGMPRLEQPIVQVYGNIQAAGANVLMRQLTRQLNALNLRFSLRLLSDPLAYGRYHSTLLRFEKSDYPSVQPVLRTVYRSLQRHYNAAIPAFTRELAPGLGLAEAPVEMLQTQSSTALTPSDFGRHRCQIIAAGLIAALNHPQPTAALRLEAIAQQSAQQGVDWQRPYLNPGSVDIYCPIELG